MAKPQRDEAQQSRQIPAASYNKKGGSEMKGKFSKFWFKGEKRPYTVQASDERFAICTKPFNLKHTVLYTIVDFKENIRGTENLIFCAGFEDKKDCLDALERLQKGKSEISHRNRVPLEITKTQ